MDIIVPPSMKEQYEKGFFNIPYFIRTQLEHDIHEEQEKAFHLWRMCPEFALVCGNRWGKGDFVKDCGCWLATYKPVEPKFKQKIIPILNTSISQDQANIVFDKFNETCVDCPKWSWIISDIKKSPFPHIKFKTDVIWWFRNASHDGKFLEGRPYFWANFDEADLQNDLNTFLDDILSPRLWDFNGMLTWTTTPRRGKRNAFKRWDSISNKIKAGSSDYGQFRGDSRSNRFLSSKAIERMNKLSPRLKNKNVLGLFEDADGCIPLESLDLCETLSLGLLDNPDPKSKYVTAYDLARSSTYNVGVTLELSNPIQLRSFERFHDHGKRNKNYWQMVCEKIRARKKKWPGILAIDATGIGDVVSSFISDVPHVRISFGNKKLRNDIIETGSNSIIIGDCGLPLSDPRLNTVYKGEFWSAREELIDFDPDSLHSIVWDFVCALFIAIYIAKGKSKGGAHNSNILVPMATGVPRS